MRYSPPGFLFETKGSVCFPLPDKSLKYALSLMNSKIVEKILLAIAPTLDFHEGPIGKVPVIVRDVSDVEHRSTRAITVAKIDWDSSELSWDFQAHRLLLEKPANGSASSSYSNAQRSWQSAIAEIKRVEEENNHTLIYAYGLQDELTPEVPLREITLNCNPHFRYGGDLTDEEREERLRADTMRELISYAVGCMMGRYSLDEPGLIYAHAGNEGFDPLRYGDFPADEDGIVPITEIAWFDDDAAIRFEQFLKVAWSPKRLAENLKFVADSLGAKSGELPIDTIRRYLTKDFYKDHLKTFRKRPIYWLFSSGKNKAFECLVYLHRYNEGTLARMRMEYVTPLQGRISGRIEQLGEDIQAATSTSHRRRLEKEKETLAKKQEELANVRREASALRGSAHPPQSRRWR